MGTEEKIQEIRGVLAQLEDEMDALSQEYTHARQELRSVMAKIDKLCSDGQAGSFAEALEVLENFMRKLKIDL